MNEILIIVFSLVFGSFGNNVISFYTSKTKFDFFRSHCMCGEKTLNFKELLPIVNFIFLRGKCLSCEKKLPIRYLIIELLAVIIGLLSYYIQGISVSMVLYFLSFYILLLIGTIDLIAFIIPNTLVLVLLLISILRLTMTSIESFSIFNLFLSFLIPFFFILLNFLFTKVRRNTAIGYGDIKLIFVLTLMFQTLMLLIGIWISSVIAIIGFYFLKMFSTRFKQEYRIPFGFFLSVGFIVLGFLEEPLINFFYNIIGF